MTKKQRTAIAKLAQRMLAVQLEIAPKAKTKITFEHARHYVRVSYHPKARQWSCAAIKHKVEVAEWEAIKQRMNELFASVRYPVDQQRKLMESQLLVARAAKMRIKEARRVPTKES